MIEQAILDFIFDYCPSMTDFFRFTCLELQGSRLTAFELVHDKIPATLIADSAAAALMKAGRVNAVIVGADRIAANGISGFEVDIVKRNYINYKVK